MRGARRQVTTRLRRGVGTLVLVALLGTSGCTTEPGATDGGATPLIRDGQTLLDPEPTTLAAPGGTGSSTAGSATPGPAGTSGTAGRETTTAAPQPLDPSGTWLLVSREHLEVMRPDGSQARRLVPDIDRDGRLGEVIFGDWSPDGESVAFTEIDKAGSVVEAPHAVIWTVRSDGSGARKVEPCAAPCTVAIAPAWSPDGTRLAYATGSFLSSAELWTRTSLVVLDLRTGARQVVVRSTDGRVGYGFPRWSPDGTRLAFELTRSDSAGLNAIGVGSQIAVVSLSKGPEQQPVIISGSGWASQPDWDRRSGRLLWSTNINPLSGSALGDANVVTADASGGNRRLVTRFAIMDAFAIGPVWTPDGEILFSHCLAVNSCWLAWVRADGTGLRTPQQVKGGLTRVRP